MRRGRDRGHAANGLARRGLAGLALDGTCGDGAGEQGVVALVLGLVEVTQVDDQEGAVGGC